MIAPCFGSPEIVSGDVRVVIAQASGILATSVAFSDVLLAEHPELGTVLERYSSEEPRLVPNPYGFRPCTAAELAHIVVDQEEVEDSYLRNPRIIFLHSKEEVDDGLTPKIASGEIKLYGRTKCGGDMLTTTPVTPGQPEREGLHNDLGETFAWRVGINHGDPDDPAYCGDRGLHALTHTTPEIAAMLGCGPITTPVELRAALRSNPDVLAAIGCRVLPLAHGEAYTACTGPAGVVHCGTTFDLGSLSRHNVVRAEHNGLQPLPSPRRTLRPKLGSVISFVEQPS